jgi:transposase
VVLCVDEKSGVQALDRTAPVLPLLPATPQRRSHDYTRHGTTNLYAALNVASGKVISQLTPRHRAIEFKRFLARIDKAVPAELDVHLICDNSSTHYTADIRRWLLRHPRFQLHFTPTYSSWLNLVERWFAELTSKWLKRGTHRSVAELTASIQVWIDTWNEHPRPFVWTKTVDQILATIAGYLQRISNSGHSLASTFHERVAVVALASAGRADGVWAVALAAQIGVVLPRAGRRDARAGGRAAWTGRTGR